MQLRIFTRRTARQVDPADVLERPRPMRVEEVHKTLTGLKLIGFPTTSQDSRRVSVELKAEDPVESPIADRDSVIDLLRSAFAALRKQQEDDESDSDGRFEFSWHPNEAEFNIRLATGGWVTFAFDQPEPPPAKAETKATKAGGARKAAASTSLAMPPEDSAD